MLSGTINKIRLNIKALTWQECGQIHGKEQYDLELWNRKVKWGVIKEWKGGDTWLSDVI